MTTPDHNVGAKDEQDARVVALLARVAELESENELWRKAATEARERRWLLQRAIDALPRTVFVKDRDLRYAASSALFARDAGVASPDDLVGKNDYELASTKEQADGFRADDLEVMTSGRAKINIVEKLRVPGGEDIWLETSKVPLRDEKGEIIGVVGTYENVTGRKAAEAEMSRHREELLAAQSALVTQLSTPLLPIHERVLVMPLIGRLDEERARGIMERLLEGIVHYQAEVVILDLTGVPAVDEAVAGGIGNVVRAADLLGTQVILTGLQPELAKTIVEIGLDLGRVTTCATLRDGVKRATRLTSVRRAG